MRIYAKVNKRISYTSYTARTDKGIVIVDLYDWPVYDGKHVVICAPGQKPVSFMAIDFSLKIVIDLLKVYAKAYL